jgi:mediator of RNA polymerase II transcription subunit 31
MSFPSSSSQSVGDNFAITVPSDEDRFYMDLEFLQCLTNAKYLNFLATEGYFELESFMNYLRHLQYWKDEKYMTFITYPQSLVILDTLINEEHREFRDLLKDPKFVEYFHTDQGLRWEGRDVDTYYAELAAPAVAPPAGQQPQNPPK